MRKPAFWIAGLVLTLLWAAPAFAGSHLWIVNEVFSNADGTIQFVEMKECCGAANEIGLNNKWVLSDATGIQYDFTANLPAGSTANQFLLLATAGFAALPGAPTPDHIVPDNFIGLNGDTITYWLYATATMTYGPGELPTDGVTALLENGTTAINSPTNFAGDSGSVDVSVVVPDSEFQRGDGNENGTLQLADALLILGYLFNNGSANCLLALDVTDNDDVSLADGISLLSYLFGGGAPPPPPFMVCGQDPSGGGALDCASYSICP